METVLVWTLLYWNSPTMISPGGDKTIVHASTGYFRTENECWARSAGTFKTFPTARYSCARTLVTKAEIDLVDERTAKSNKHLEELAEELRRKYAPVLPRQ